MQQYILNIPLGTYHRQGDMFSYDPEWGEWTCGDFTYDYRGNIRDGEMAMLLNFMASRELSTLLELVPKLENEYEQNQTDNRD
jgi:hypothetical protein